LLTYSAVVEANERVEHLKIIGLLAAKSAWQHRMEAVPVILSQRTSRQPESSPVLAITVKGNIIFCEI
jgi:hypothetical protein